MGMFQVRVSLANPQETERTFEELFWVDTGALYSSVPEDRLGAINLAPSFTRDFVLADGRKDRRRVGEAHFTIEGLPDTMTCPVVFGQPGSLFLLGVTALENFCVQPDPVAQKLRPITALLATYSGRRSGNAVRPSLSSDV